MTVSSANSHLDWCAVTYPHTTAPNGTLPRGIIQGPFRANGRGVHGYKTCLVNDQGILILMDGAESMGVHLVLSGTALGNLRDAGLTDKALCEFATDNGKIARLDAAVNILGGKLTPKNFARAYNDHRLKTPARSGLLRLGVRCDDQNFTLGNRQSNRFMRIYDKRAETKTQGPPWLRIELECHRAVAQVVASALAASYNPRTVINRAVRDFCDLPNPEFQAAIEDISDTLPEVPRKEHSTVKWLIDQVAPAMRRYQDNHPNTDVLAILASAYDALPAAQRVAAADDGIYRA